MLKSGILYFAFTGLALLCRNEGFAQKEVVEEHAAWGALFGSVRISKYSSIYTDLHHIDGTFTVARLGLTRHLPHNINLTAGHSYAWLPVPGSGSDALKRHEHRPWLQVNVPHSAGQRLRFATRFRYDMRFRERVEQAQLISGYVFNHRLRLQETLRLDLPSLRYNGTLPFLVLMDEVLLNFGKNITHNTFDQNRLGIMAGIEREQLRLQAGYFNWFVQSGTVPNRYTIKHNYTVWLFYTLDLRKPQQE
ncbi:MAG: DUF2490 domain-containing protein [Pontibacter sp.]|nr:DUF2490 domain-containing protein [Pontibacter sp.]